jgi:capsid protein
MSKKKNKYISNAQQEAKKEVVSTTKNLAVTKKRPMPSAYYSRIMNYGALPIIYDGQKNLGELGPVTDLFMNYPALSLRGHHAYATNEVVQIIINRMADWVIGNGLWVESEPNESVLKMFGIDINVREYSDSIEALFSLIKESDESTHNRMNNLSELERISFVNGCNGGANLVVIRVRNGIINYELIDGAHIESPYGGTDFSPLLLDNGNRIVNGIEMSNSGEHIRYWVKQSDLTYKPIEAREPFTGMLVAFLYGGDEGRIDDSKARPALAGILETLSQMDAYKGATLGSAKEQNKVAYQTVYDVKAEGDSIFSPSAILSAADVVGNDGTIPIDEQMQAVADRVTASTGNKAIAVPPGGEIKAIGKNEAELYFESFWNVLFKVCCATKGLPASVALMSYNASFSAARAEIKDWAHSMMLKRYKHRRFLKPGYELQLHLDILTGKVKAPGYLKAFRENNTLVLEAFRKCRWVGDAIFEIDELKEIAAVRAKMGPAMANVPLMTQKQAVETLGGGDVRKINENSKQELKDAGDEFKVLPPAPPPQS